MSERTGQNRRSELRDLSDRRDPERVLPHSIDSEKAVLGALLISAQVFALLPDGFDDRSFYREAHRLIYRALFNLHERQVAIDILTVREELTRTGDLEQAGGAAYLTGLVDGVPRSTNAAHYAGVVTEHAVRRAVILLANQLLSNAYEAEQSSEDLIAEAQQGVIAVSAHGSMEAESIQTLMTATRTALELAVERQQPVIGVATGLHELDAMTAGLQRGELSLLAARPSVGKTAMATNIAEYAAAHMGLVLLFSLEMTKDAIMRRMVSSRARVEGHRLRTGQLHEADYPRISLAMVDLEQLAIVIDDTSGLPVEDLTKRCRRVMVEHGTLSLIVVDYLQLLRTRSRHENRNQQVSFISGALKGLAKDLDVAVLALSQLSRGVEGRKDKRPLLSDLRESGSLEQDADLVMFLHRPDDDAEAPAELIVAKQRNGPVGTVRLKFNSSYTRFENLSYATE